MKIRHTTALALAGTWILLAPPQEKRPSEQTKARTEAPLNQWSVIGTFPTEKECDNALHPKALLPKEDPNGLPGLAAEGNIYMNSKEYKERPSPPEGSKCATSDDPRLKP
jgi:hypothetical protein